MKQSNFLIDNIGLILIVFTVIFLVLHFNKVKKGGYKTKVTTILMSSLTFLFLFSTVIYYKEFHEWGNDSSQSSSSSRSKKSIHEQEMLNNGWKKNESGTSSNKYCSTHSTMYNPNNAYGGCPKCFDKSWKDELNKPGGFRDRVSRP